MRVSIQASTSEAIQATHPLLPTESEIGFGNVGSKYLEFGLRRLYTSSASVQ